MLNESQIVNDDRLAYKKEEYRTHANLKLLMMIDLAYKKENVLEPMLRTNLKLLMMIDLAYKKENCTRTHAQNESQIFSNDMTRIIIIVTIIVIIGVGSYALYKIYLIRRKSKQSKLK